MSPNGTAILTHIRLLIGDANCKSEEKEAYIVVDEPRWRTSDGTGVYTISFNVIDPVDYDGVAVGICDDRLEGQEEELHDYSYEEGHCIRYRLG